LHCQNGPLRPWQVLLFHCHCSAKAVSAEQHNLVSYMREKLPHIHCVLCTAIGWSLSYWQYLHRIWRVMLPDNLLCALIWDGGAGAIPCREDPSLFDLCQGRKHSPFKAFFYVFEVLIRLQQARLESKLLTQRLKLQMEISHRSNANLMWSAV